MTLPSGTVTLLFSDVEGSTRLLQLLGEDYEEVLEAHRAIVRRAIEAHGGRVVDCRGDEFFAAFARPHDAAAAAAEMQAGLESQAWPDAVRVRVRVGVHTGEPTLRGDSYYGLDVHHAARLCQAGHGGQVLLSERAAAGVAGADTRDLGSHRLRGLPDAEHIFQLGAGAFPRSAPTAATCRRACASRSQRTRCSSGRGSRSCSRTAATP